MSEALTYLEEFAQRTLALCKEAIPGTDGVDHFFYKGSATPYFTMRLGADDAEPNSEDMVRRGHVLTVRYVIGHVTSKYSGVNERRLYKDVPTLEDHFASCGFLQSSEFPKPMDFLTDLGFAVSPRGLSVFAAVAGLEGQQVGTEFNVRAVFTISVEDRY